MSAGEGESAIIRLDDAIGKLSEAAADRSSPNGDTQDLDVAVCLAVRAAFTAFVDYFGWLDDLRELDESRFHRLRGLMCEARDCIDVKRPTHEYATDYAESIARKIDQLDQLKKGAPLGEVFVG